MTTEEWDQQLSEWKARQSNAFVPITQHVREIKRREAQYREASANFQTAQISRLTQSWTQTTLSPDAQARMDLKTIRARARELRDNNDYARKFCTMLKTNVLGDQGIHFRNKAKDPDRIVNKKLIPGTPDLFANRFIADKWYAWGRKEHCTVTGKLNWCDVQKIVLETAAVDGEALIRKVRRKKSDNPFGFTLQLIEADYLDDDYDTTLENGNEVRMGIEIDQWGRKIAYHLRSWNPNDSFVQGRGQSRRYRVPAEEIIHLHINTRSAQTRGMSWFSTSGYRINMLGKYEEAEVTASRVAASKMAFITKSSANSEYNGEEDAEGNRSMDSEPGAIEELPFGSDIKTLDWNHPNSSYQVFMKTALRGVAAGLGVSYNSLAEDMESVNFASGKLGLASEREVWKALQYWFIESFCEEIFSEWLLSAMTAGALDPLPMSKFEKFNQPYFIGRRWGHVNPQQEVAAIVSRLENRLTSHQRVLAEDNIDIVELFEEIRADKELAAGHGFELSAVTEKIKEQGKVDLEVAAAAPQAEMTA
jgi:lambda family phage portal protein